MAIVHSKTEKFCGECYMKLTICDKYKEPLLSGNHVRCSGSKGHLCKECSK